MVGFCTAVKDRKVLVSGANFGVMRTNKSTVHKEKEGQTAFCNRQLYLGTSGGND